MKGYDEGSSVFIRRDLDSGKYHFFTENFEEHGPFPTLESCIAATGEWLREDFVTNQRPEYAID